MTAKQTSPWAQRAASIRTDIATAIKAGTIQLPVGAKQEPTEPEEI